MLVPSGVLYASAAEDDNIPPISQIIDVLVDGNGNAEVGSIIDFGGGAYAVKGDLLQTADIHLNGGILIVDGDWNLNSGTLYTEGGKMIVNGTLNMSGGQIDLSAKEGFNDGGSVEIINSSTQYNGVINGGSGSIVFDNDLTQNSSGKINAGSGTIKITRKLTQNGTIHP